jgi:hypothetical protein
MDGLEGQGGGPGHLLVHFIQSPAGFNRRIHFSAPDAGGKRRNVGGPGDRLLQWDGLSGLER